MCCWTCLYSYWGVLGRIASLHRKMAKRHKQVISRFFSEESIFMELESQVKWGEWWWDELAWQGKKLTKAVIKTSLLCFLGDSTSSWDHFKTTLTAAHHPYACKPYSAAVAPRTWAGRLQLMSPLSRRQDGPCPSHPTALLSSVWVCRARAPMTACVFPTCSDTTPLWCALSSNACLFLSGKYDCMLHPRVSRKNSM